MLSNVVNGADVRIIERRNSARASPSNRAWRSGASAASVATARCAAMRPARIHFAHPSGPQRGENFVGPTYYR